MTNKEASEELKEEFEIFKNCIKKSDWENPDEELRKIIEANTMAIEVLGQQPCEDCVSRADVLALAEKGTLVSNGAYKSVCKAINELPSVTPKYTDEEIDKAQLVEQAYVDKMVELAVKELKTPKAEWIPVSERLPETDGIFLTYIENPYDNQLSYIMICDYIHQIWCPVDETASSNVIAWMPLPQPYKAESEE